MTHRTYIHEPVALDADSGPQTDEFNDGKDAGLPDEGGNSGDGRFSDAETR